MIVGRCVQRKFNATASVQGVRILLVLRTSTGCGVQSIMNEEERVESDSLTFSSFQSGSNILTGGLGFSELKSIHATDSSSCNEIINLKISRPRAPMPGQYRSLADHTPQSISDALSSPVKHSSFAQATAKLPRAPSIVTTSSTSSSFHSASNSFNRSSSPAATLAGNPRYSTILSKVGLVSAVPVVSPALLSHGRLSSPQASSSSLLSSASSSTSSIDSTTLPQVWSEVGSVMAELSELAAQTPSSPETTTAAAGSGHSSGEHAHQHETERFDALTDQISATMAQYGSNFPSRHHEQPHHSYPAKCSSPASTSLSASSSVYDIPVPNSLAPPLTNPAHATEALIPHQSRLPSTAKSLNPLTSSSSSHAFHEVRETSTSKLFHGLSAKNAGLKPKVEHNVPLFKQFSVATASLQYLANTTPSKAKSRQREQSGSKTVINMSSLSKTLLDPSEILSQISMHSDVDKFKPTRLALTSESLPASAVQSSSVVSSPALTAIQSDVSDLFAPHSFQSPSASSLDDHSIRAINLSSQHHSHPCSTATVSSIILSSSRSSSAPASPDSVDSTQGVFDSHQQRSSSDSDDDSTSEQPPLTTSISDASSSALFSPSAQRALQEALEQQQTLIQQEREILYAQIEHEQKEVEMMLESAKIREQQLQDAERSFQAERELWQQEVVAEKQRSEIDNEQRRIAWMQREQELEANQAQLLQDRTRLIADRQTHKEAIARDRMQLEQERQKIYQLVQQTESDARDQRDRHSQDASIWLKKIDEITSERACEREIAEARIESFQAELKRISSLLESEISCRHALEQQLKDECETRERLQNELSEANARAQDLMDRLATVSGHSQVLTSSIFSPSRKAPLGDSSPESTKEPSSNPTPSQMSLSAISAFASMTPSSSSSSSSSALSSIGNLDLLDLYEVPAADQFSPVKSPQPRESKTPQSVFSLSSNQTHMFPSSTSSSSFASIGSVDLVDFLEPELDA